MWPRNCISVQTNRRTDCCIIWWCVKAVDGKPVQNNKANSINIQNISEKPYGLIIYKYEIFQVRSRKLSLDDNLQSNEWNMSCWEPSLLLFLSFNQT